MNPLSRIHRLKASILALVLSTLGLGLLFFAKWAESAPGWEWVTGLPAFELGSTLFITGAVVVAWDYMDGRDKERRDDERTRRLLKEAAPDFRDAVVRGFAVSPTDLKRVATPELLDSIATNAMGLRLDDPTFAAEVYEGVRDQAIRAPERWYDVSVSIRLSQVPESLPPPAATSAASAQSRTPQPHEAEPVFAVTVRWEYTVVPASPVRRFACTSDRDEFYDLITDTPATSAWYLTPRPGIRANDRAAFELLQFTIDGEEQKIRRSERKTGQTYTVNLGNDVVHDGKPVRIGHAHQTLTTKSGHRLRIALSQPTKNLSVSLDYTDTDITHMAVGDLISTTKRARVRRSPGGAAAREVALDAPGWLLPQVQITYVWTLASEDHAAVREDHAAA